MDIQEVVEIRDLAFSYDCRNLLVTTKQLKQNVEIIDL